MSYYRRHNFEIKIGYTFGHKSVDFLPKLSSYSILPPPEKPRLP
jgi:hypothetical protein